MSSIQVSSTSFISEYKEDRIRNNEEQGIHQVKGSKAEEGLIAKVQEVHIRSSSSTTASSSSSNQSPSDSAADQQRPITLNGSHSSGLSHASEPIASCIPPPDNRLDLLRACLKSFNGV